MLPILLQFLGILLAFFGAVLMIARREWAAGPLFLAVGFGLLLILATWRLFGVL